MSSADFTVHASNIAQCIFFFFFFFYKIRLSGIGKTKAKMWANLIL